MGTRSNRPAQPDQAALNEQCWADPAHWSGGLFGVYFCKRDTRILVPKRRSRLGWTLNLAHPAGVRWFFVAMLSPTLVLILVILLEWFLRIGSREG